MMMRTAGGPGLISPIDFGERKRPLPRSTWIALGVVALAHAGVGLALYHQRFEIKEAPPTPEAKPITIEFQRPLPPPPLDPVVSRVPPAPNPPVNRTPAPPSHVETLTTVITDTPSTVVGPVINTTAIVPPEAPAGVGTGPVQPPAATVIRSPQWVSRPNADQLMRAYPSRALNAGATGSATLSCLVRVDGGLTDCSVLSETPGNQGFGRAAIGLSRYFRMSPQTVNGQAVDGARVDVGIRFTIPD